MAHRRSGAKRRSAQKLAQRSQLAEQHRRQEDDESTDGDIAPSNAAASPSPAAAAAERVHAARSKPAALMPQAHEVVAAVASLYMDQLKPFGRILRKRIAERHAIVSAPESGVLAAGSANWGATCEESSLLEVDVPHLRAACDECAQLRVELEEGGDWSVTLVGCPSTFVDVYSAEDVYPCEMWLEAAAYFETSEENMTLPGGRYSCAHALLLRDVPFLRGRSLGQACHFVQLAISKKKLLGYLNGAVVPYSQSQSMIKEKCAGRQQALSNPSQEAAPLPVATWEAARKRLRSILEESAAAQQGRAPGVVPLSNVKRLFRSQFQLELSETVLGHSKLSELLQDSRFGDICAVKLEGHGYSVIQAMDSPSKLLTMLPRLSDAVGEDFGLGLGLAEAQEPRKLAFCSDEPLCLEDAREPLDAPAFGATPGPFGPTPVPSPYTAPPWGALGGAGLAAPAAAAAPRRLEFMCDEPLCLEDAQQQVDEPVFAATPGYAFGPTPLVSPSYPPGVQMPNMLQANLTGYPHLSPEYGVLAPPFGEPSHFHFPQGEAFSLANILSATPYGEAYAAAAWAYSGAYGEAYGDAYGVPFVQLTPPLPAGFGAAEAAYAAEVNQAALDMCISQPAPPWPPLPHISAPPAAAVRDGKFAGGGGRARRRSGSVPGREGPRGLWDSASKWSSGGDDASESTTARSASSTLTSATPQQVEDHPPRQPPPPAPQERRSASVPARDSPRAVVGAATIGGAQPSTLPRVLCLADHLSR